ncbi:MAG: hydroxyacylglutathione hydrolase [Dongiaceae bacterium]
MTMPTAELDIAVIPLLKDNYGYLVHDAGTGATAALDPSEAQPMLDAAKERGWRITHILNTHHHNDHCGGNLGIKQASEATIVGPAYDRDRIPGIDQAVDEDSGFDFAGHHADVLFIPGHTRGHIAFYFSGSNAVFCGDTLFSIGCGRTFEGTAQQMWASLRKLRDLPDETWIYCGHEYTEANCRFAVTVEPENRDLVEFAEAVKHARAQGDKTIPSSLGIEKFCNPFLRADQPRLLAKFGGPDRDPATAFGAIRRAKDSF